MPGRSRLRSFGPQKKGGGTGGNGTARKRLEKEVRRGSSLDGGTFTGFHKMPIRDKDKMTGSFFRAYIEGCPFFSN